MSYYLLCYSEDDYAAGSDSESAESATKIAIPDKDKNEKGDVDCEESEEEEHRERKKRRRAYPEIWKKSIRKHNIVSGKSYVNVKGKVIPTKEFADGFQCNCPKKCHENITDEERKLCFETFYSSKSWECQTAFLCSLVKCTKVK